MEFESRREFLKFLGVLVGSFYSTELLAGSSSPSVAREVFLITNAARSGYGHGKMIIQTPPGSVRVLGSDGKVEEIPISFFGHTLDASARTANLVATFEQFGKRGALVDLRARKVVMEIKARDGNGFTGHAAFSPDKKYVYTSEQNYFSQRGEISVRDAGNFNLIQTYSSYGVLPHECRLIENGKKLLVANNHGPTNIAYIETSSGKLLHKVTVNGEKDLVFSHFDISHDNWLFAAPRLKSPYAVLVSPGGKIHKLKHPATKDTGILSASFIGGDLLVATYPEGNFVQVWNYKTQQSVASLSLPNPRGVVATVNAPSGDPKFLVSLAVERTLKSLVITGGKTLTASSPGSVFGGSGSHLVRLTLGG